MNVQHRADPFEMMMNPQAVLAAIERSDRLQRLQRRVCRPLDKPLIPHVLNDLEAYDLAIDEDLADDAIEG
jgi:hypothetical protein